MTEERRQDVSVAAYQTFLEETLLASTTRAYCRPVKSFLAAVRGEEAPAVSGTAGRRALAAALRVIDAMAEQRASSSSLRGGA